MFQITHRKNEPILKLVGEQNPQEISHQKMSTRQYNLNNVAALPCENNSFDAVCRIVDHTHNTLTQGRIQEFAQGGGPSRSFSSLPFTFPLFLSFPPLTLKRARRSGERCKFPQRVRAGASAENEFGAL